MFFRNLNAKNSTAKIGKFPGILINDSLLLYNITKTFMLWNGCYPLHYSFPKFHIDFLKHLNLFEHVGNLNYFWDRYDQCILIRPGPQRNSQLSSRFF